MNTFARLFENREKAEKIAFILCVFLVFISMLILNFLTPYLADDYAYMLSGNIGQAFKDEYTQYMTWGGRSVVHFIARIFLNLPKGIFNFANAVVYVWLTVLIYILAQPRKKYNLPLYLFIIFSAWIYIVQYGQTVLWVTGACNYLWGTAIILTFYLPYYMYMSKKEADSQRDTLLLLCMPVFGVIAGWCNENTSGGLIVLIILTLIYCKKYEIKMKKWMISGLAGTVIGFLFMVLAPGNAMRSSVIIDKSIPVVERYINGFLSCTETVRVLFPRLLVIFVILFVMQIIDKQQKKRLFMSFSYFIVSASTLYALALAPYQAWRAMFGVVIFLIIASAHCFAGQELGNYLPKVAVISLPVILGLNCMTSFPPNLKEMVKLKQSEDMRQEYVNYQIAEGNKDILIPLIPIPTSSKYNPNGNGDFSTDPNQGFNPMFSKKRGIDTLTAINYDEWKNTYANDANLKLVQSILKEGKLLHSEEFLDIYYFDKAIYYVHRGEEDISATFLLHFAPKDPANLSESRVQFGFENGDFNFEGREIMLPYWDIERKEMVSLDGENYRVAKFALPEYELLNVITGQYNEQETLWLINITADTFK